jgi:hypothetical protein
LTATGFDDDKKYTIVGSNPLCIKIALSETGEAYLVSLINDLNRLAERDNSS